MKAFALGSLLNFATLFAGVAHATTSVGALKVADHFDYSTDRQVHVSLQVFDHTGMPAANRLVEILDPASGGSRIVSGMTDDYGMFEGTVTLANRFEQVRVRTNVLGINNEAVVDVHDESVDHVLR